MPFSPPSKATAGSPWLAPEGERAKAGRTATS